MEALCEDDTGRVIELLRTAGDRAKSFRDAGRERDAMSADADARLLTPVILAVTTGMRLGEIVGLRWQDVDLDAETVVVAQVIEQTKA